MDSDLHKKIVGVRSELILENAKKIAAAARQIPDKDSGYSKCQRFRGVI
jgi:hypothetical protein